MPTVARESFSDILDRPHPMARGPTVKESYGELGSSNEIEEEKKMDRKGRLAK